MDMNKEFDIDYVEYYVEYNLDGNVCSLENHHWLLEELLCLLKRMNGRRLLDGSVIKCSHLINELENTLKDQREVKNK